MDSGLPHPELTPFNFGFGVAYVTYDEITPCSFIIRNNLIDLSCRIGGVHSVIKQ